MLTQGTSLDTVPRLTLRELRVLFLKDIEAFNKGAARFKNVCFKAEFGYYDLNAGKDNMPEDIVKGWKLITERSISAGIPFFPEAMYKDADSKRIYYFDGSISVH